MRLSALSCQNLGLASILTLHRTYGDDGRRPAQLKLSATLTVAAVMTVLLALGASRARAVDFDFLRIADLNTLIPSGSGNFTGFGSPSLDGGNVAFQGFGSGQSGIYTDIDGLDVVADRNTPIPGGSFSGGSHRSNA